MWIPHPPPGPAPHGPHRSPTRMPFGAVPGQARRKQWHCCTNCSGARRPVPARALGVMVPLRPRTPHTKREHPILNEEITWWSSAVSALFALLPCCDREKMTEIGLSLPKGPQGGGVWVFWCVFMCWAGEPRVCTGGGGQSQYANPAGVCQDSKWNCATVCHNLK